MDQDLFLGCNREPDAPNAGHYTTVLKLLTLFLPMAQKGLTEADKVILKKSAKAIDNFRQHSDDCTAAQGRVIKRVVRLMEDVCT